MTRNNIPDAVINKVKPLYDDPEFEPDKIKKGSLAAMGICKWVRAMVVYDKVAKEVGPKRQKLAGAEAEVAEAEATVAAKQAELKEVMDMVADLEAQLHEANEKAKELSRNQKDLCCQASPCGEAHRWTRRRAGKLDCKEQEVGSRLQQPDLVIS